MSANNEVSNIHASSGLNKNLFIWYAFAITFLGVSATDIYISSLPKMIIELASDASMVNLTISIYTLGMGIGVLFAGILSNRFGRKNTLQFGILLYSIASFGIAFANTVELIIVARLFQALGCSFITIVPRLIMKDCMATKEQMRASGILVMGFVISPAIAPSIGTLLSMHWGWRSCFTFNGVFGVILLIIGAVLLKETNSTPITSLQSPLTYLKSYAELLNDKVCQSLSMVIGLTLGVYFTFIGISSYLFIDALHMTPLNYSYMFIFLSVGFFIGNSIMLVLNENNNRPMRIIQLGLYASTAGMIVCFLSLVTHNTIFIASAVILGITIMRGASSLIIGPSQVQLVEHFGKRGAEAISLATCAQFVFSSIAISGVAVFHNHPLYGLLLVSSVYFIPTLILFKRANAAGAH